jgi:hypothetical protein
VQSLVPASLHWLASLTGYLVIVTDARGLTLWRRQGPAVSGVLIDTTSEHALSAKRARLRQALELAGPAAGWAWRCLGAWRA